MGGGSNSTSSSSRSLTPEERLGQYNAAMSAIQRSIPMDTYRSPTYTDAGPAKQMSNGDYTALENSIVTSRLAPLKQFEATQREALDSNLAKRGVWSSGLAARAHGDLTNKLADNYQQAGADAVTQRYGLQAQDLAALNSYNLNRAGAANTYNAAEADKIFNAKWRPADYLAGIWNGTGGTISSGSGGGWNFSI